MKKPSDDLDVLPTPATTISIQPPNFQQATVRLVGTSPYVSNKFSARARSALMETQMAGSQSKKGKKREPKNFEERWRESAHLSTDGWYGMPASSIRNAMISACRTVGFRMTLAKLSLFVDHDGLDVDDATPLLKIIGEPKRRDRNVRLATGVIDIMTAAVWDQWEIEAVLRWDADQFSAGDVINLLSRAGQQVGVGAGRPDSKMSNGMGWGTFRVATS